MTTGRAIIIIIDACGVGELPDAAKYGDSGASTLPNIAAAVGGLNMPTCQQLGLGNIASIKGIRPTAKSLANFGKMTEKSSGKDSTAGHWEIGGIISSQPFPVFPDGFPEELVAEFENRTGVKTIGNIPASGTEIINELGVKHLQSKELILYTSADSVFQLAAHEEIYPLERLYEICRTARKLLTNEFAVARVIARPFVGRPGNFTRTAGRRDFSLNPPGDMLPDTMRKSGLKTMAVGKIYDLFARRGFDQKVKTKNNTEVMQATIAAVKNDTDYHLIFANCVDFDMLWGHRNDVEGFAHGLEEFDRHLGSLLPELHDDDMLIITADHGCDPTIKTSTDHTREYVPLLVYGRKLRQGQDLGTRSTFSDIAATLAERFRLEHCFPGESFLKDIIQA